MARGPRRLPGGVARQRLVVAKKLAATLPTVDEALSAGRIGFDHARVFADVVNDRNQAAMEPLLEDLIAATAGTVFNRWRDDVTALAAYLDPDGSHDPDNDHARNRLTLSPSDDVMLLRGELAGERALCVHDTLNAVADELFHQYERDHDTFPELGVPNRATLLALALDEICRRALAVDRASTQAPKVEATLTIHAAHGSCSCSGGDDPSGLAAARSIQNRLGLPLPAATLPTFLCDPVLHAALIDRLASRSTWGELPGPSPPPSDERGAGETEAAPSPVVTPRYMGRRPPHPPVATYAGPTNRNNLILVCRPHHRSAPHLVESRSTRPAGPAGLPPPATPAGASAHHRQRAHPSPRVHPPQPLSPDRVTDQPAHHRPAVAPAHQAHTTAVQVAAGVRLQPAGALEGPVQGQADRARRRPSRRSSRTGCPARACSKFMP